MSFQQKFGVFTAIAGVILLILQLVLQNFTIFGLLAPLTLALAGGLMYYSELNRGKPKKMVRGEKTEQVIPPIPLSYTLSS